MKPQLARLTAVLAATFGSFLSSGPALAQAAGSGQTLERVTITGSNIKRTDVETASPVQVITREDIARTGKQSIQDVLRGVTADGVGSIPSSFSNGFASGSAAVSLRGLGVNSTLVLVNGRRMTTYGLADDGTRSFVDLNSLPLEVVERIEVLKDGASAIYGADAVGGVVNVILRKSYTGASIGGTVGRTGHADGATTRAYGSLGFGDLEADRYNVFFSLEASKQKNIWAADRGYIGQADLRSQGYHDLTNGAPRPYLLAGPASTSAYGVTRETAVSGARINVRACAASLLDPDSGLCRYNGRLEQEVQPQVERLNLYTRGTLQIGGGLSGYAELGYFNTRSSAHGTLGGNNDSGVYNPSDPFNPLVTHDPMNLPASHPDNRFGVDRTYFDLPPLGGRDQQTDNRVYRLVAGLQGTHFGWDWDGGVAYIRSELENRNFGYIDYGVMQGALDDGSLRISDWRLNDPALIRRISPTLVNRPTSSVKSIDFKASRELMALEGGSLGLALGAEYRWEAADTPPVPGTDTSDIVGLGYSAFADRRKVYALYGELSAPITRWLELNGALRYDHYSDFGSTTNPKLGFKLMPANSVAIRGTYAEAFRAPGPAETGGSTFGFTSVGILSQGNSNLKPEEARSYTLGLILEPTANLSTTIDYWKIDRKNEIVQADPNSIIPPGACTASCDGRDEDGVPNDSADLTRRRLDGLKPNTFLYYDAQGELTVTGYFENAAKTRTDGFDVELRHRASLGEMGRVTSQLNWSHTLGYDRTDAAGDTYSYEGTHGPLSLSAGGGAPKDRATFTLTWDRGSWAVTGGVNYVGKMRMVDHLGETTAQDDVNEDGVADGTIGNGNTGMHYDDAGVYDCGVFHPNGAVFNGCKLGSFTTYDLYARWSPTKNLELQFSIQNLFDKKAPFDPYLAGSYGDNYNQTWHQSGAVGRYFTVGARYAF